MQTLFKFSIPLLGGLAAWLALALLAFLKKVSLSETEIIFLFAPLVIMPMALAILNNKLSPADKLPNLLIWWSRCLQPVMAGSVIFSFLLSQGVLSGVLASSWLVVTSLLSLWALQSIFTRGVKNLLNDFSQMVIEVACLYISVGAGWLALYRFGIAPMNFSLLIVLLTAVHFHYAGFGVPVLAGLLGAGLSKQQGWLRAFYQLTVFLMIAGVPMVAVGITFSPLLEVVGAFVMASGGACLGALFLRHALQLQWPSFARLCFAVSGLAAFAGMSFAILYGVGEYTGAFLVSIPQMIRFHGWGNAVGFVGLGMLAWNFSELKNKPSQGASQKT